MASVTKIVQLPEANSGSSLASQGNKINNARSMRRDDCIWLNASINDSAFDKSKSANGEHELVLST
eukprot:scaffold116127_cov22-Prasinocladus_malaysianus.AAC.1